MNKVRLETSGPIGILSLANPPLNLFDQELSEDLRTAVNQAKQLSWGRSKPQSRWRLFRPKHFSQCAATWTD
jgi:hypothetical protein